jgi:hypothetical protein
MVTNRSNTNNTSGKAKYQQEYSSKRSFRKANNGPNNEGLQQSKFRKGSHQEEVTRYEDEIRKMSQLTQESQRPGRRPTFKPITISNPFQAAPILGKFLEAPRQPANLLKNSNMLIVQSSDSNQFIN